jgi:hypothetical protein
MFSGSWPSVIGASSKKSANIPSCLGSLGDAIGGSENGLFALPGGDIGMFFGACGLDSRDRDATSPPKLLKLKPSPAGLGFGGNSFVSASE